MFMCACLTPAWYAAQLPGGWCSCIGLPHSWSPNVTMQRSEAPGMVQTWDIRSWPGCACRCILLSWWEMPGVAAESLSTTEYKMLKAGTPCVSDWMHNLVEFYNGRASTSCIHLLAAHDTMELERSFYWGRRVWKRIRENFTTLFILPDWRRPIKNNPIPMLYFYREAKITSL